MEIFLGGKAFLGLKGGFEIRMRLKEIQVLNHKLGKFRRILF